MESSILWKYLTDNTNGKLSIIIPKQTKRIIHKYMLVINVKVDFHAIKLLISFVFGVNIYTALIKEPDFTEHR